MPKHFKYLGVWNCYNQTRIGDKEIKERKETLISTGKSNNSNN